MQHVEKNSPKCRRYSDISEYLDGELSPSDELSLEQHFSTCSECRTEFNLQKQFHNVLSSTLEEEDGSFELPDNFVKAIVTAAENDISSVRGRHEFRNAFAIVIGIILLAGVVASLSGGVSIGWIGAAADKAWAVLIAVGHLIYTIALGVTVILRSLSAGISNDSGIWLVIAGVVTCLILIPLFYYRPRRSGNV